MNKKQIAIIALKAIQYNKDMDTEQAHVDADRILLTLVPEAVKEEYNKIKKWYG